MFFMVHIQQGKEILLLSMELIRLETEDQFQVLKLVSKLQIGINGKCFIIGKKAVRHIYCILSFAVESTVNRLIRMFSK